GIRHKRVNENSSTRFVALALFRHLLRGRNPVDESATKRATTHARRRPPVRHSSELESTNTEDVEESSYRITLVRAASSSALRADVAFVRPRLTRPPHPAQAAASSPDRKSVVEGKSV